MRDASSRTSDLRFLPPPARLGLLESSTELSRFLKLREL